MTPSIAATDRRITVVMVLSGLLALGMIVLFVVAVPAIFTSRDNSSRVAQGNELAACRSSFNAAVLSAQDAVEDARAERDNIVLRGLVASAVRDEETLRVLTLDAEEAIASIDRARVVKSKAVEEYASAVELSRERPEEFLSECKDAP